MQRGFLKTLRHSCLKNVLEPKMPKDLFKMILLQTTLCVAPNFLDTCEGPEVALKSNAISRKDIVPRLRRTAGWSGSLTQLLNIQEVQPFFQPFKSLKSCRVCTGAGEGTKCRCTLNGSDLRTTHQPLIPQSREKSSKPGPPNENPNDVSNPETRYPTWGSGSCPPSSGSRRDHRNLLPPPKLRYHENFPRYSNACIIAT